MNTMDEINYHFQEACKKGHHVILDLLMNNFTIDINARIGDINSTALMSACFGGHTEITKILLVHHTIDVNVKNDYGFTALMYACFSKRAEIIKILLAYPAIDVNTVDNYSWNSLMILCLDSHYSKSIFKFLLYNSCINIFHKTAKLWLKYPSGSSVYDIAKIKNKPKLITILEQYNVHKLVQSTKYKYYFDTYSTKIIQSYL